MKQQQHLVNIDMIKFIASICIVLHHYQQVFRYSFSVKIMNFYGGFIQYGYLVELFFIISGFFAAYTLKTEQKFVSLYVSKIKKLWPSAVLSVLAGFIIIEIYQIKLGGYLEYQLFNTIYRYKFSAGESRVDYRICSSY